MLMILIVSVVILVINIFFGYWRANTRKFSLQWIAAIHTPVPLAIGLRLALLGWNWMLLPVFVAIFAAGQYIGSLIRRLLSRQKRTRLSSWLIKDLALIIVSYR